MQSNIAQFGELPTRVADVALPTKHNNGHINGFPSNGMSMLLFKKTKPEAPTRLTKKILIIDRYGTSSNLIGDCLMTSQDNLQNEKEEKGFQYELEDARDYE